MKGVTDTSNPESKFMTLRSTNGDSFSKLFSKASKRMAWITKLHRNIRKKLDKLGNLIALAPASLNSTKGITLYFDGSEDSLARIEKVLDVKFADNKAVVKFSRITLNVTLIENVQVLAELFCKLEKSRKAA